VARAGKSDSQRFCVILLNSQELEGEMSIYFARSEDHIKIGFSVSTEDRLASLATSNPNKLELLAVVPGSMAFERAIHSWLFAYHVRGEWFRDCPQVRQAIEEIKERGHAALGFIEPELPPLPEPRSEVEIEYLAPVHAAVKLFKRALDEAQQRRSRQLVRDLKKLNKKLLRLMDKSILEDSERADARLVAGANEIMAEIRKLVPSLTAELTRDEDAEVKRDQ
jgi:hypothetical protein